RGGHPCLWLTVPTAKPVADFHRQVIAHAGRTTKNSLRWPMHPRLFGFVWDQVVFFDLPPPPLTNAGCLGGVHSELPGLRLKNHHADP
ncbi:hypothetical protein, partial [Paenibacillus lactis]